MAFFFRLFPEIIKDGRLYISEPPLYRINDKKDPFVINMDDYINRYINTITKEYKLGYQSDKDPLNIEYMSKDELYNFLKDTSSYLDDVELLVKHYKINDRVVEIILEEFADKNLDNIKESIDSLNIQKLMNHLGEEFKELYYDEKSKLIKGAVDGKHQLIEISESLIRKSRPLIEILSKWLPDKNFSFLLKNNKTGSEHKLSILGILKILRKYQPDITHRFKGLGENDFEDIKTTIMDPNTRSLIKVNISDIENDMKIFQMLRGGSPIDLLNRKQMMREFKINKSDIDT